MNENQGKLKKLWTKFKSIKHYELIIAGVFALIILIIYFTTVWGGSKSDSDNQTTGTSYTAFEYAAHLEDKLSAVLSNIKGAGKVSVMITLASGMEYEYAMDEETKTSTSGNVETSTSSSTPILNGNGPIVIKEIYPKISGVIVVSEGASEFSVRLELIKAVEAVLDVPTSNIEILVGNK